LNQISATYFKNFNFYIREKAVLFWNIAWPTIILLLNNFLYARNYPENLTGSVRATTTIMMIVITIMISCISMLPGNISEDRVIGLFKKLISMPIKPWKDFVGRILSLMTFSLIAVLIVLAVGIASGARFSISTIKILQAIYFIILIILSSAGIGLIIGSFLKHIIGAIMTGIGITVLINILIGLPYKIIPDYLKVFLKFLPFSSINSSLIHLLVGESFAGYNPFNAIQAIFTPIISIIIFIIGLILYSNLCWRSEK